MNKNRAVRERHLSRLLGFRLTLDSEKLSYYESKKISLFSLVFVFTLFLVVFYLTGKKELVVRIGLFALFFALYKCYEAYRVPVVKLDEKGIAFRFDKYKWIDMRKINVFYKNDSWIFVMDFFDGKKIEKKIPYNKIENSFQLPLVSKEFKKNIDENINLKFQNRKRLVQFTYSPFSKTIVSKSPKAFS